MTEIVENVALIAVLMLLGVGATIAVLLGLIYFLEMCND